MTVIKCCMFDFLITQQEECPAFPIKNKKTLILFSEGPLDSELKQDNKESSFKKPSSKVFH